MGVLAKKERTSLLWWHVGEVAAFWLCGGALLGQWAGLRLWAALGLHGLGFLIYAKMYLLITSQYPDLDKKVKQVYPKNLWFLGISLVTYWIKIWHWEFVFGAVILTFSFAIIYRSWHFRDTGGHPVPWNDPVWKDFRFYPGW